MSGAHRWLLVGVGVTLLVAAPFLVRAVPVDDREVRPTALLTSVLASRDVAFTGFVESRGGVSVPSDDSLASVAKLVGRTGSLRVWWADEETWRVATLRTTGETDLLHRENRTLRWVYESKRITISPDVPVRLPNSSDVLPNVLARRVLDGARDDELSRIGAERVAGRTALGLRFTPADSQASIGHVDVWADAGTGLPLRVALYPSGGGPAALDTRFVEVELGTPDAAALTFQRPDDSTLDFEDTIDLAAAADRYADRPIPDELGGLPSRAADVQSVGVYGRGPTVLLAMPLREDDAESLRHQIRERPGARCIEGDAVGSMVVAAGPLQMLVTREGDEAWLVTGTVTEATVEQAAVELVGPLPGVTVPDTLEHDCR